MYNNPYFNMGNPMLPMQQKLNMPEYSYPQYQQQSYTMPQQNNYMQQPVSSLQGKSVDSLDVVKAMDIPLDGSISYFPLTDGSAIITKQLQMDGTSKTIIYKPMNIDDTKQVETNYITQEQLEEILKQEPKDIKELKDDIKNIKRQIRDISEDVKDFKNKE